MQKCSIPFLLLLILKQGSLRASEEDWKIQMNFSYKIQFPLWGECRL